MLGEGAKGRLAADRSDFGSSGIIITDTWPGAPLFILLAGLAEITGCSDFGSDHPLSRVLLPQPGICFVHLPPSHFPIYLYICWRSGSCKKGFHKASYGVLYFMHITLAEDLRMARWKVLWGEGKCFCLLEGHCCPLCQAGRDKTNNRQTGEQLFCVN